MTFSRPAGCGERTVGFAAGCSALPADLFEVIVSATAEAILAEMRAGTVVSGGGRNREDVDGAELGQIPAGVSSGASGDGGIVANVAAAPMGDAA